MHHITQDVEKLGFASEGDPQIVFLCYFHNSYSEIIKQTLKPTLHAEGGK